MSYKEVQDAKHRFTTAKPETTVKRGKTTFLDGIKISETEPVAASIEFHFKDKGEITEDTNGSYAMRREYPSGHKEYFVKYATTGGSVNRMLNPWGLYFTAGDETKVEKMMGRKRYEFRRVKESVFDAYLKFLSTQNQRYLLNAEREAANG